MTTNQLGLESYTNSALKCARECPHKYNLQYRHRMSRTGLEREVLTVGSTWHAGLEGLGKGGVDAGIAAIATHAPSELWREKLQRALMGYIWYYQEQPLNYLATEYTFELELAGEQFTGQIDGIVEINGKRGIIEYKTTSDSLDPDSMYWNRLALDTQVGLYSLAVDFVPDFILYDVHRKPTIRQKAISKKDCDRMHGEMKATGTGVYYGEKFAMGEVADAIAEKKETIGMYGARLNSEMGNDPQKYFHRREVYRTAADYRSLVSNLVQQIHALRSMEKDGTLFRNPDACALWNTCEYLPTCTNNILPIEGQPAPDGFHFREHLHPELH